MKEKKKESTGAKGIAGLAVFLVLGAFCGKSFAFDLKNMPQIPAIALPSQAEFEARTTLQEEHVKEDPALSFSVRLPSDWVKSNEVGLLNFKASKRVVGEMARYYGPVRMALHSRFSVMAVQLEKHITATNWFINYILSSGYTLEGLKTISDKRAEGLFVLLENDVSYLVRAVAEINGSRMILAFYYAPYRDRIEEAAMQEMVIGSFTLLTPDADPVEVMDTHSFVDLAEFDYPVSWTVRAPDITSIERMNAFLLNAPNDDRLDGEIDIYLVAKTLGTSAEKEFEEIRGKFMKRMKMTIEEPVERIADQKHDPALTFHGTDVFAAGTPERERMLQYEVWLSMLEDETYYYFLLMLTPSRDGDFYVWAQNSEAYELVTGSIRPVNPLYEDEMTWPDDPVE